MPVTMDVHCIGHIYTPGEVVALLTPVQELVPGLYLLRNLADGWATLSVLIDDEAAERLVLTSRTAWVPSDLLPQFMPVGIQLGEMA